MNLEDMTIEQLEQEYSSLGRKLAQLGKDQSHQVLFKEKDRRATKISMFLAAHKTENKRGEQDRIVKWIVEAQKQIPNQITFTPGELNKFSQLLGYPASDLALVK